MIFSPTTLVTGGMNAATFPPEGEDVTATALTYYAVQDVLYEFRYAGRA
jgi:hypothetical protein